MARMCEKLGCLPAPGGLLDQDPIHVTYLEQVWRADGVIQEEDRKKEEQKSGTKRARTASNR